MIRDRKGFTLIEVVVVIAIIGILAAVALPNYLSARPKIRLNRAVNEYHGMLQRARLLAIKNRGDCTVSFTSKTQYSLSCVTGSITGNVDLNGDSPGVEMGASDSFSGAPSTSIVFNSRGTANQKYVYFKNQTDPQIYRVGPLISGVIIKAVKSGSIWNSL